MSIRHTYAVDCDGGELMFDRVYLESTDHTAAQLAVEASRIERRDRQRDCKSVGPGSYTSAQARKDAAGEGWTQHRETHPRYPGADGRPQRKAYDLCPVCAPKVVQS